MTKLLSSPINKRTFLGSIMGALLAASRAGAYALEDAASGTGDVPDVLRSASMIGDEAVRAGAIEPDGDELAAALGLTGVPVPEAFGRRWAEAMRADFDAGDTVVVEGWVLSRTEARLCALASIYVRQAAEAV